MTEDEVRADRHRIVRTVRVPRDPWWDDVQRGVCIELPTRDFGEAVIRAEGPGTAVTRALDMMERTRPELYRMAVKEGAVNAARWTKRQLAEFVLEKTRGISDRWTG